MKLSAVFWVFSYPSFIFIYTACLGAVKLSAKVTSSGDWLRHLYWFIIQFTVEVLNFHWKKFFSVMPVVQPLSDFLVRNASGIPGPHIWSLFYPKKCDAIRNFILQRFSWDQTTWANIMWPCSILLPLCLDQFNSSLQIEQLRNSLFSVNYVINAFLFPVFTFVCLKWK